MPVITWLLFVAAAVPELAGDAVIQYPIAVAVEPPTARQAEVRPAGRARAGLQLQKRSLLLAHAGRGNAVPRQGRFMCGAWN